MLKFGIFRFDPTLISSQAEFIKFGPTFKPSANLIKLYESENISFNLVVLCNHAYWVNKKEGFLCTFCDEIPKQAFETALKFKSSSQMACGAGGCAGADLNCDKRLLKNSAHDEAQVKFCTRTFEK